MAVLDLGRETDGWSRPRRPAPLGRLAVRSQPPAPVVREGDVGVLPAARPDVVPGKPGVAVGDFAHPPRGVDGPRRAGHPPRSGSLHRRSGPVCPSPSTGVFDADGRSGLPRRAAFRLDRDESPDPNGDLVRESGLEAAFPPNDLADPEAELAAIEAAGATEQVPLDLHPLRRPHLAVEVRLELPQRPLAVHHVTRPRSRITSHNRRSRALLPRCSRDITVPIGTSRISAISL